MTTTPPKHGWYLKLRCLGDTEGQRCPDRYSEAQSHAEANQEFEAGIRDKHYIIQRFDRGDDGVWATSQFTILSPDMRCVLSTALDQYPGLDLVLAEWTFQAPYVPLVHRWDQIQKLSSSPPASTRIGDGENNSAGAGAAAQLVAFLKPLLSKAISSVAQARHSGMIAYADVWKILPPGELAILVFPRGVSQCRVVWSTPSGVITVEVIYWNGQTSASAQFEPPIPPFEGTKPVTDLQVWPATFNKDGWPKPEMFQARGFKFERLRGSHLQYYHGPIITTENETVHVIAGRVMIDAHACHHLPIYQQLVADSEPNSPWPIPVNRNEDFRPLTDEQRRITAPFVLGIDLQSKEWSYFLVSGLEDIKWDDNAFDNLFIEPDHSQQMLEVALGVLRDPNHAPGWRPVRMHLWGPSGTGKTYVAEAVSERARRPLYVIEAEVRKRGHLAVERALGRAFVLCGLWNAILVLDNADVLLDFPPGDEKRRDALLSMIDRFPGDIFYLSRAQFGLASSHSTPLTRLKLSTEPLPFHRLQPQTRRKVWTAQFNRRGPQKFAIDPLGLLRLSELKLNGKQIKEVVSKALGICSQLGSRVTLDLLLALAQTA